MARAAAKRRQPTHHDTRRKHKDSGGQRYEDTLFFNKLRKRAKWVFIFLAVVFAVSFALFGVGSSVGGGGGLSDIFNGIRGGGGGTSIKKSEKKTQENPKDATAWHDLAVAYDSKGMIANAISAWTTYTTLRPKNVEGLTQLASDYETQFSNQTQTAAVAQADAQNASPTNFGPPSTSPLGRALGSLPDPITQSATSGANQRFNDALTARQATAGQLMAVYQRIAALHNPPEPSDQILLAQAAQNAGNTSVAIAAYKKFIQLAPDDPQATFAKQQIKTLGGSSSTSPQG